MPNAYQLKSGASVLVEVVSSSNLDGTARKSLRRGSVLPTIRSLVVQYLEPTVIGDAVIEWRIPIANGSQRGTLQSAALGSFGDQLIFKHPSYGEISWAFVPGAEGYEEEPLMPVSKGYSITCRGIRLA